MTYLRCAPDGTILTRSERIALDWLRAEQGDRPSFRLRFARLSEETGLSQKDAGHSVDALRRAGFIEIDSTPLPHKRHYCRVCEGSTHHSAPVRR